MVVGGEIVAPAVGELDASPRASSARRRGSGRSAASCSPGREAQLGHVDEVAVAEQRELDVLRLGRDGVGDLEHHLVAALDRAGSAAPRTA